MLTDLSFKHSLNLPFAGSIFIHGLILLVAGVTWSKRPSSVFVGQRGHQGPVEFTWLPNASDDFKRPNVAKTKDESRALESTRSATSPEHADSHRQASYQATTATATNASHTGGASSEWSAYEADVMQLLQAHKRYPEVARRMRQQGRVKVQFEVDRLGQVLRSELLEPCPHDALNQAAQTLIAQVQRFKPFPPEVKQGRWVFTVPIEYRL